jgi:hypothetical protein
MMRAVLRYKQLLETGSGIIAETTDIKAVQP